MQIKAVAKLNMTSLRVVWEAIRHFFMLAPVASQTLMRRRVLDVALVDRHWRRRQLRGGRARTSPGTSPSNSTITSATSPGASSAASRAPQTFRAATIFWYLSHHPRGKYNI